MKKFITITLLSLIAVVSCKKFDDSKIWDKLNDHENRILLLEELCKKLNADIINLQTIVTALETNDYIINASPLVTGDGYTFLFKSGKSIVVYNGKDGTNGKDGVTPQISIKQDVDGVYYWTINGEWLIVNGEKVQARAEDGEDGTNGSNGITPQFKIEDDYWYISYDNGKSWERLGKAKGDSGLNGEDGDNFFCGVSIDDDCIYFILNDGNNTTIKIPYYTEDTLVFVSEKEGDIQEKLTNQQKRYVINLAIEGNIAEGDIRYIAKKMLELAVLDVRGTDLLSVPEYAFCKGELKDGKESIREVYLPDTCSSIGDYAFYGCINLSVLYAPNVINIGKEAFQHCTIDELTVTLGGDVQSISNCNVRKLSYGPNATTASTLSDVNVETVHCHTGISQISSFGPNYQSVIFEEPSTIKTIEYYDFSQCAFETFVLPTSVETIEHCAFTNSDLKLLVIPPDSKLSKIETDYNSYNSSSQYVGAFYNGLETSSLSILCHFTTPLSVNCLFRHSNPSSSYNSTHYGSNGTLYVPRSSVALYQASHWGKDFKNIVAIEDSEYSALY